ncbi:Bidirectional sugar transporter SWEET15 [Phytophthora citrophthora]|uniref:Sugar transporter SWEET1 n=1 Tax=Phytophthora citrophthora TaxID=4793 RepID=A0AAD9LJP1_9STRA|nr:Bidirectional sugar transporter SWEET15 [Phytophthora citrophthora]
MFPDDRISLSIHLCHPEIPMVSAYITALKVLTTIVQVAQRLSPAPDLYPVYKNKDTGVIAFMPFVMMLLCNHVWLLYAYAAENIFPLFSVCVFGDIVLVLYVAIYAKYCPDRAYVTRTFFLGMVPFVLVTAYAILVAVDVISQSRHQLGVVLGYLADATTFALFLSPFEKIKLVIATKSAAAIPVYLCGITFVNSFLWVANGIIEDDLFILVPNAVGAVLTGIQLTLCYIYRPATEDSSDSSLEMGRKTESTPKRPSFVALASPKTPVKV